MSNYLQRQESQAVKGSIKDTAVAKGITVAEAFAEADAVVVVDTSGSMAERDAGNGRTRYMVACEQLAKLQADMPGRVAVVSFSDQAIFCPSGVPTNQDGSTDMAEALRFVHRCDGLMRIVMISDGLPDAQEAALREAARFTAKIDTIYVGAENGYGRDFLRRLAEATGGIAVRQDVKELGLLAENVQRLLLAGA